MKRVAKMTNEELVALFEEISIAQSEALDRFETARFNRLYDKKSEVVDELHSRPGDQRHLLFPLYHHRNKQVQLDSARFTYEINSAEAHAVIEQVASSRWYPQAGDAGMTLAIMKMEKSGVLKIDKSSKPKR